MIKWEVCKPGLEEQLEEIDLSFKTSFLHFLLEGQMVVCNQVGAIKLLSFHWLKSPILISLKPLQQVTGGVLSDCVLGTQTAPVHVSSPREPALPHHPSCLPAAQALPGTLTA